MNIHLSLDNDNNTQEPTCLSPDEPSYQVATCQKLGRYLVAAKNLRKGEIIFQEYPIAAAPQKNSSLICPGCFVTPKTQCGQCMWPICGENCPTFQRHVGECQVVQRLNEMNHKKPNRSEEEWIVLQDKLMIFRCLDLKTKSSAQWDLLWEMEALWNEWSKSPLYENALELVTQLRHDYGITEEQCSTDEILKVLAILDINAYEVKMPDVNIQGCYKLASLAEHACLPNAFKTTSSNSLLLTMRALTDIPKGANIATSYCDIFQTTSQRQRHLQWSKFFVCECQRCTDPTELGSFISSILCPNCPTNNSPISTLTPILTTTTADIIVEDEEEEIMWKNTYKDYKCNKCGSVFPATTCESFVIQAERQLQELDKQCTVENRQTDNFETWLERWTIFPAAKSPLVNETPNDNTPTTAQAKNLSNLAVKRGQNKSKSSTPLMYLHPQHALCLDACHTIFLLYSAESSCMDELLRKSSLGTHLLQSTTNLFTGISLFRGTIMYELAMTKAALFARYLEPDEIIPKGEVTIKTLAKEIMSLLTESLDHLRYESKDQPEGKLFALGLKQLDDFQTFLGEIVPDL